MENLALKKHWWLILIGVISLTLRLLILNNDMVSDEITSLFLVRRFVTVFDAFTLNIDNNHSFNSLYLAFFSFSTPVYLLRLHSFTCGVLLVVAAGYWGARSSQAAMLCSATATGLSTFLIVRSVMARGYIHMFLLCLLAWIAFECSRDRKKLGISIRWALGFSFLSATALIAHTTYVHALGGFVIAQVYLLYSSRKQGLKTEFKLSLARFIPVLVFLGYYYHFHLSKLIILGGPRENLLTMLWGSVAGVFGPARSSWSLSFIIATLYSIGVSLRFKELRADCCVALGAVLLSPVLVVLVTKPKVLLPSYFLVGTFVTLLVCAKGIGQQFKETRWSKSLWTLVIVWLVTQGYYLIPVAQRGFAPFRGAVSIILEDSKLHQGRINVCFPAGGVTYQKFDKPPRLFNKLYWLPNKAIKKNSNQPEYVIFYVCSDKPAEVESEKRFEYGEARTYRLLGVSPGSPFTEGSLGVYKIVGEPLRGAPSKNSQ